MVIFKLIFKKSLYRKKKASPLKCAIVVFNCCFKDIQDSLKIAFEESRCDANYMAGNKKGVCERNALTVPKSFLLSYTSRIDSLTVTAITAHMNLPPTK